MAKKLNKVPEAAEQFCMTTKGLWNWIADGRIGVVRLGRNVRIPQEEIDRLIQEGYCPARRSA